VALVVAADAGAIHAAGLGLRIDRLVGDGDSIPPGLLAQLERASVDIVRASVDKDETDAELALLSAVESGADEISIVGALAGERTDHALANVGLLAHPALAGRRARLYDHRAARITLMVAPASNGEPVTAVLQGRPGDVVSLIPVGADAVGVTTSGLRFALHGDTLTLGRTRGVSNLRTRSDAQVTLESGRLLAVETPARVRP
jgi:thiamine pyrophosphokinase